MSNNENETIGSQTEMQDAVQSFEELLTPDNEKEQVETPEEEIAENQVEEVEAEDLDPEEDLQETEEETEFDEDISEEDEIKSVLVIGGGDVARKLVPKLIKKEKEVFLPVSYTHLRAHET